MITPGELILGGASKADITSGRIFLLGSVFKYNGSPKIKSTSSTWAQKAPSDKQALNAFIFGTYFTISSADRTPSIKCALVF